MFLIKVQQTPSINMYYTSLWQLPPTTWQDGASRVDLSSLLSVCGDSWLILGAMNAHAPQVCSPHPAQSLVRPTQAR